MLSFVYGQATGAAVDKEFGVKTVYLEGAYDQLDTSWLANNKNKAADSILKQDC
ncbi:MAG: hypothetical protein LBS81_03720 [Endomicrobium sp.]|nr:hypothetical protein [Endomicrobium sp.]